MRGGVHPAEKLWVNGEPTAPRDIRAGDTIESTGSRRRARVTKATQGSGRGTIWLHGASGAQFRCLLDQRVRLSVNGRTSYRRAEKVKPGDFMVGMVSGFLCVDPVVAVRRVEENVPAIYLEMPSASLLTEEGLLVRPS